MAPTDAAIAAMDAEAQECLAAEQRAPRLPRLMRGLLSGKGSWKPAPIRRGADPPRHGRGSGTDPPYPAAFLNRRIEIATGPGLPPRRVGGCDRKSVPARSARGAILPGGHVWSRSRRQRGFHALSVIFNWKTRLLLNRPSRLPAAGWSGGRSRKIALTARLRRQPPGCVPCSALTDFGRF